jgi:NAD(P)-dependent dehydrogenase (short-subunit alcohol dehydrogenase family)
MPPFAAADIPSQAERTVAVTGATGGLGFETALALVAAGAEVIILGRNPQKAAAALDKIRSAIPSAKVRFEHVDVSSLASVNAAADVLLAQGKDLDVLVNNAGVMALPQRALSVDGFEMQLATNHLGHFLLTARLLPLLRRRQGSRVVNVSSLMHRVARMELDDLQSARRYSPNAAYANSKLANLLFTAELQRRSVAGAWGVASIAAHPGASSTDLIASGPGAGGLVGKMSAAVVGLIGQSAADGALPSLYAAAAPDALPGGYYGPSGALELRGPPAPAKRSDAALDKDLARRFWDASVALTGAQWPDLA